MTVTLLLVLVMFGQKPTNITLPMPDIKTCMAEAARFLNTKPPKGSTRVLFKGAMCGIGDATPGTDVKQ
jgi:hypothetical protein